MRYLAVSTVLCAAFLPAAEGQNLSANPVTGLGYLYPSVTVAPGQLITVFLAGNAQGDISATVQGLSAPVLEVRPGTGCASASLCSGLTAITIQIPYELNSGCGFLSPVCNLVVLTQLIVTVSGVAGAPGAPMPLPAQVFILTSLATVGPRGGGPRRGRHSSSWRVALCASGDKRRWVVGDGGKSCTGRRGARRLCSWAGANSSGR